ncbi:hypothetical protein LCGC14_1441300 [marine sediment metagenome]|uniref:Uncharacterized protein n=1 Tax=marine sediment metagenome TaxID=412755 RepID=A0A0F9M176_9ZZZZ
MERRTILEVVLALGLVIFGGMALLSDKAYHCDANKLAMNCDKLTQYYGLPNGKCWNPELGNKLCRSGWEKDFVVEDEGTEPELADVECPIITIAYVNNCQTGETDKYFCNEKGECKSTEEILSELG